MSPDHDERLDQMDEQTLSEIEGKARRKLRSRRNRTNTLWFGLGTMGIVGWSIAIPALIGIAAGLFLDENVPSSFSWTLTGLIVGIVIGCLNAWVWINQKQNEIRQRREDDDS